MKKEIHCNEIIYMSENCNDKRIKLKKDEWIIYGLKNTDSFDIGDIITIFNEPMIYHNVEILKKYKKYLKVQIKDLTNIL